MLLKSLYSILVGFSAGIGVAAGTFAFLIVIRVIPRIVQKSKLENKVITIENTIVKGILFGTIVSLFTWKKKWLYWLLGKTMLTFFGISAGIFTGCIAVALAEILDTFPIFFRRIKLNPKYCEGLLFIMALGKMIGSFFYFMAGYGSIGM